MSDPQSTPDDSSESTPSELPADQTGTGYLERAQGALSALTESRMAMLGLVITFAMLILALGAPIFAPNPPTPFWEQGGTLEYPLGTDQQGRGILSRSLYGLRLALIQGTVPVLIAGIIGVTLGLVSGFFGGWVDVVISRVVDTVMSIPLTLFAIAVIAVLGANLFNLVLSSESHNGCRIHGRYAGRHSPSKMKSSSKPSVQAAHPTAGYSATGFSRIPRLLSSSSRRSTSHR